MTGIRHNPKEGLLPGDIVASQNGAYCGTLRRQILDPRTMRISEIELQRFGGQGAVRLAIRDVIRLTARLRPAQGAL